MSGPADDVVQVAMSRRVQSGILYIVYPRRITPSKRDGP
jgi:hypothetical protein